MLQIDVYELVKQRSAFFLRVSGGFSKQGTGYYRILIPDKLPCQIAMAFLTASDERFLSFSLFDLVSYIFEAGEGVITVHTVCICNIGQ